MQRYVAVSLIGVFMAEDKRAESGFEQVKRESRFLRGRIAEVLAGDDTHFDEEQANLLKPHGTYQQDDRDQRAARRDLGQEKAWMFFVRCAIPGGRLSSAQFLALDHLAQQYGNGSMRLTTRQGVQIHYVRKHHLKSVIAGVNRAALTTVGACGDNSRNVTACPAPLASAVQRRIQQLADEMALAFRPMTRAYREIWLDEPAGEPLENEEPFYGPQYLPRKFKIGISAGDHNCIDADAYDCSFTAVVRDGELAGFNLGIGGGMGMTYSKGETVAALAEAIAFVPAEHAVDSARAAAEIFRDHGNRLDRKQARIKYLLANWGVERFRQELADRLSFSLADPVVLPVPRFDDHLGVHPQGDGRWFLGVHVHGGRVGDDPSTRIRTALRTIAEQFKPPMIITAQQHILLAGLTDAVLAQVQAILRDNGVPAAEELSPVRRHSFACVALPTCGLAMAESERVLANVVERFERELEALGLAAEPIGIQMTGCPNGCARPYTANIGLVGRRMGQYGIYVGGGLSGQRVGDLYADSVPLDQIVPRLRPLLESWAANRKPGESLGDFYQRSEGASQPRHRITGKEQPKIK